MGVYIPNWEKPKSCDECWVEYAYEICNSHSDCCPLVSVSKHGRCIDADVLKTEVFAHDKLMKDGWNNMDMGMFTGNLMEIIDAAPAIIPADPKEEELK